MGPTKKPLSEKSTFEKNLLEAEYSEPLKCAFKFLYQKTYYYFNYHYYYYVERRFVDFACIKHHFIVVKEIHFLKSELE